MTKASEVLKKALESFGPNGEKWINRCPQDDSDMNCSVTAIYRVTPSNAHSVHNECIAALESAAGVGPITWLGSWNDSHTWPEVKAAFEKAIANCQQAEGIQ